MTRIIAGLARGRRLEVPKGDLTRPTSDRVREALFSILQARDAVHDARVIDLFCGSGALGLEAASRGAADVVLVDSSRAAAQCARANADALGLPAVSVVTATVQRYLAGRPVAPATLVLLDPPYAVESEVLDSILMALDEPGRLAPDALVVLERSRRSAAPAWPRGWRPEEPRRYGDTTLWLAAGRSG